MRTQRYRYTEWEGGKKGVELYDYQTDLAELKNLANDLACAKIVAQLTALIAKNRASPYYPTPKNGNRVSR